MAVMICTFLALVVLVPVPETGMTVVLLALAVIALFLLHRLLVTRRLPARRSSTLKKAPLLIAMLAALATSAVAGELELPPVATVPETGQTIILLTVALVGLIAWRHKARKKI